MPSVGAGQILLSTGDTSLFFLIKKPHGRGQRDSIGGTTATAQRHIGPELSIAQIIRNGDLQVEWGAAMICRDQPKKGFCKSRSPRLTATALQCTTASVCPLASVQVALEYLAILSPQKLFPLLTERALLVFGMDGTPGLRLGMLGALQKVLGRLLEYDATGQFLAELFPHIVDGIDPNDPKRAHHCLAMLYSLSSQMVFSGEGCGPRTALAPALEDVACALVDRGLDFFAGIADRGGEAAKRSSGAVGVVASSRTTFEAFFQALSPALLAKVRQKVLRAFSTSIHSDAKPMAMLVRALCTADPDLTLKSFVPVIHHALTSRGALRYAVRPWRCCCGAVRRRCSFQYRGARATLPPLPTATNRQSPTTNRRQLPPTATNRQLPSANRQLPPTTNRQPPPTMVGHMECPRAFLGKLCNGTLFFFLLRTALARGGGWAINLVCEVRRFDLAATHMTRRTLA